MNTPSKNQKFLLVTLITISAFAPLFGGATTYIPVAIIRVLSFAAIIQTFISGRNEKADKYCISCFDLSLIAQISLFMVATVSFSAYIYDSLQWTLCIINYISIYILTLRTSSMKNQKYHILLTFILISVFESFYGIIQYAAFNEPRAKGTFFNPNYYALYLSISFLFILSILLSGSQEKREDLSRNLNFFFSKTVLLPSSFIIFSGIILAASRGVFIFLFLVCFIIALMRFRGKAVIVFFLIVLIIILIPNPVAKRFEVTLNYDIFGWSRIGIWKSTLNIFYDYPWGTGPAMFKYYFPRYNFPIEEAISIYGKQAKTPHNEYLQFISEMGIAGLLFLIISAVLFIGRIKPLFFSVISSRGAGRGFETGLLASILLILLHIITDASLHDYSIGLTFAIITALAVRESKSTKPFKEISIGKPVYLRLAVVFSAVLFLIISIMLGAGQYYRDDGIAANRNYNYRSAEKKFSTSLRFIPFDAETFNARANLNFNQFIDSKNIDYLRESLSDEKNAISLNKFNSSFYYYTGKILLSFSGISKSRQHLQNALSAFEKAKSLNPYNPFYRLELAAIYDNSGRQIPAKKELFDLIALEPNFLPAFERLYWIYDKSSEIQQMDRVSKFIKDRIVIFRTMTDLTDYDRSFFEISAVLKERLSI